MIVLYTIGCPKCKVLEKKLNNKNITYTIVDNKDEMINLGLNNLPMLNVDNNMMDYNDAIKWVNEV